MHNPQPAFWKNLKDPKTKLIINMVKGGAILEEIGREIKVTRQRAHQIIVLMECFHGDKIWKIEERWHLVSKVARNLGVSVKTVINACQESNLPIRRRGKCSYMVREDAAKQLISHPRITSQKTCVICRGEFFSLIPHALTCSLECFKKRRCQTEKERYHKKITKRMYTASRG